MNKGIKLHSNELKAKSKTKFLGPEFDEKIYQLHTEPQIQQQNKPEFIKIVTQLEKEKIRSKKRESNEEIEDKNVNTEPEFMAVTRAMTKQMLEPKTQETFIDPPPPTQQEIDQMPEEAKKESKLFSLELIKKEQQLDSKL
uniref:Uncharacterized protein n=1 Tax=Romanomermis culicivorax TaxID=13658 RepID=A0A915KMX6_ROMCU